MLYFLYFKILLFNFSTLKDVRRTFINCYLASVIFGPLPDASRSWIRKLNWKMLSRIKRENQKKRKFHGKKESKIFKRKCFNCSGIKWPTWKVSSWNAGRASQTKIERRRKGTIHVRISKSFIKKLKTVIAYTTNYTWASSNIVLYFIEAATKRTLLNVAMKISYPIFHFRW